MDQAKRWDCPSCGQIGGTEMKKEETDSISPTANMTRSSGVTLMQKTEARGDMELFAGENPLKDTDAGAGV